MVKCMHSASMDPNLLIWGTMQQIQTDFKYDLCWECNYNSLRTDEMEESQGNVKVAYM